MYRYDIDLGTILFAIGSLLDVIATKIKYYGDRAIAHMLENKDVMSAYMERRYSRLSRVAGKNIIVFGKRRK